jgi:hypothetical protein
MDIRLIDDTDMIMIACHSGNVFINRTIDDGYIRLIDGLDKRMFSRAVIDTRQSLIEWKCQKTDVDAIAFTLMISMAR